jgi:hypothetical protein
MLGGTYDPFSRITSNANIDDIISPGIHIGIVKRFIASTKSCMVLVPSVNTTDPMGPFRIMAPFSTPFSQYPAVNTKVIVAFLDGSFKNAVILGYLL